MLHLEFPAELALENDDVTVSQVAAPTIGVRRRVLLQEEVVGSCPNLGKAVDVRAFGYGFPETG